MTWTLIGDDFPDRPSVIGVSRSARLLHVEGLVWCNRHLTDGLIPPAAVRRITDAEDPDSDIAELLAAGLWERDGDDFLVDWSEQETAEAVKARRDANAERQRKYRERRARHTQGDHALCYAAVCRFVTRDTTRDNDGSHSTPIPTQPSPALPHPTPREGGGRSRARDHGPASAGATASRVPLLPVPDRKDSA